jgi:hypothetical protein
MADVEWASTGHELLGARVARAFGKRCALGTITKWADADVAESDPALFHMAHDDGDEEDLEEEEARAAVQLYAEHPAARKYEEKAAEGAEKQAAKAEAAAAKASKAAEKEAKAAERAESVSAKQAEKAAKQAEKEAKAAKTAADKELKAAEREERLAAKAQAEEEKAARAEEKEAAKAAREADKEREQEEKAVRAEEKAMARLPKPPRTVRTPYECFVAAQRESVAAANAGLARQEVTKLLGSEWKGMGDADKAKYAEEAQADRKRYDDEWAAFVAACAQKGVEPSVAQQASKPDAKRQKGESGKAVEGGRSSTEDGAGAAGDGGAADDAEMADGGGPSSSPGTKPLRQLQLDFGQGGLKRAATEEPEAADGGGGAAGRGKVCTAPPPAHARLVPPL